jgi:cytochrome c oxidase subunit 2
MLVAGLIGTAILLPISLLLIPWFPAKGSVQAGHIHTLYDVLLIATVPIFVLVETVVLFSVWKFRMRPGEELKDGPPIHGNTRLEVVWTAVPAILIIALCTYAYTVLRSNEATKQDPLMVNVTARQFAFQFSYQTANRQTVNSSQLYLPKGRPVVFRLRSLDVIHSFFVPDFSEKLDAVPGITTTLRVTPNRIGTYPVECTELCGAGHSLMRATARVVSPQAFQSWLGSQKPNTAPPVGTPPANVAQAGVSGAPANAPATGGQGSKSSSGAASASSSGSSSSSSSSSTGSSAGAGAAAGKGLFTGSAGCSSCHTLAAAGATGQVGPNHDQRLRKDCATPASKKVRGATVQQCIRTAIVKPYAYLPSGYSAGIMPSTFSKTLSQTQIQSLVNFLAGVTK